MLILQLILFLLVFIIISPIYHPEFLSTKRSALRLLLITFIILVSGSIPA